jgi:hypothetical protein
MVTEALAPKWTPRGFTQRVRRLFHEPSDPFLALSIATFMWRAPGMLRRRNLRVFLRRLRELPRPSAPDAAASLERIQRLRGLCLRLPGMRSRDNCYVRALTLYRFLDARDRAVSVHFGIEEKEDPRERLRGHAWVSLDGELFEGPPDVIFTNIKEVPLAAQEAPR